MRCRNHSVPRRRTTSTDRLPSPAKDVAANALAMPTVVACGMRPMVGFSDPMPQHWDGHRSNPKPSLPSPSGVMPVARAAASPPLEAPGVRDRSHGLTVAPRSSLSQTQPTPYVGRLVRPIGIAPAAFSRSTTGASRDGYAHASALAPCVVGVPARSMFR